MASIRNKPKSLSPKQKVMQRANEQLRNDIASARLIAQNLQNQNLSKVTEDKVKSFLSITKDLQRGKGTFTSKDLANLENLRASLDDAAEQMLAVNKNFQYELSDLFDNYFSVVNDNTYSVGTRNQKFEEFKKIVKSAGGDLSHIKSREDLTDHQTYRGIQDQLKGKTISAVKLSKVAPTSVFSNENSEDRRLLRRAANRVKSATIGSMKEAGSFALQGALGAAFGAAGLGHIDSHFGISTRLHQYTSDKLSDILSKNKDPYESITYDRFDNADKSRSFRLLENFMAPQPASPGSNNNAVVGGKNSKSQRRNRQNNNSSTNLPPSTSQSSQASENSGAFRTRITNVRMKNADASTDPVTVLREIVSTNKDINSTLMGTNSKLDELITNLSPGHRQDLHGFDRRIGDSEEKRISNTDTVTKSGEREKDSESIIEKAKKYIPGFVAPAIAAAASPVGLTVGALAAGGIADAVQSKQTAEIMGDTKKYNDRDYQITQNPEMGFLSAQARTEEEKKQYDEDHKNDGWLGKKIGGWFGYGKAEAVKPDYSQLKDARTKDDMPRMLDGYSHVRGYHEINGVGQNVNEYHDPNDRVVSRERAYGLVGPEEIKNSSPVSVQPVVRQAGISGEVYPVTTPKFPNLPPNSQTGDQSVHSILRAPISVTPVASRTKATTSETTDLNSITTTIRNLDDTLQQLIQVLKSGVSLGGGSVMTGSNAGGGSSSAGSAGGGAVAGSLGPMTYTNTPRSGGGGSGTSGESSSPTTPSLAPEQMAKLNESNAQLGYAQAQASLHGEDSNSAVMKSISGQITANNSQLAGGQTPTSSDSGKTYQSGRAAAEAYYGKKMSDGEYDMLIRATSAEAGNSNKGKGTPEEQAMIMGSILNRAKKGNIGIEGALTAKNQFQSVTGTSANGHQASKNFTQGPGEARRASIEGAAANLLSRVPSNQTNFTAGSAAAYGPGTNIGYRNQMVKNGGQTYGGSVFNSTLNPADTKMTGGGGDSGGGGATASESSNSGQAAQGPAAAVDREMAMLGKGDGRRSRDGTVHSNAGEINDFIKKGGGTLDVTKQPWCAAFVSSALEQSGVKQVPGNHNLASSYNNWGAGVDLNKDKLKKGDVVIHKDGGHVMIATGKYDANGRAEVISGNSNRKVSITYENPANLNARRATENEYKITEHVADTVTSKGAGTVNRNIAMGRDPNDPAQSNINSPENKILAERSGATTDKTARSQADTSTNTPKPTASTNSDALISFGGPNPTLDGAAVGRGSHGPMGQTSVSNSEMRPSHGPMGRLPEQSLYNSYDGQGLGRVSSLYDAYDPKGRVSSIYQSYDPQGKVSSLYRSYENKPITGRATSLYNAYDTKPAQGIVPSMYKDYDPHGTVGSMYKSYDSAAVPLPPTRPKNIGSSTVPLPPERPKEVARSSTSSAANMYKGYDVAPVKDKAPVAPVEQKAVPLPPERPITSSEMDTAQVRRPSASPSSDGHHKKKPSRHTSDMMLHALNQRMFHHHTT